MRTPSPRDVTERPPRPARRSRSVLLGLAYAIGLALVLALFIDGFSYYTTPYVERPHHPDYRALRPAGSRGLLYGIAGTSMMVLMLVYTIRKRTRLLGRTASLRPFLDFHILLGVLGPLFIVLHTSFKVQGLVAVSFWAMVAVALSGFFGRYLYLQIPRNIQGNELTLQEIDSLSEKSARTLKDKFELDDDAAARLARLMHDFGAHYRGSALHVVLALLRDDLFRFRVKKQYAREVRKTLRLPQHLLREFVDLSFERALLERRIALLGRVQQLFHYWHVIHKPFAIIMYLIVGIHIGVALWTGYGWVQ